MGPQDGPEEAEDSRVMGLAPSTGGRVSSTWKFPALPSTAKPPGEDLGRGVIQAPSPPLWPPTPAGGQHTWGLEASATTGQGALTKLVGPRHMSRILTLQHM